MTYNILNDIPGITPSQDKPTIQYINLNKLKDNSANFYKVRDDDEMKALEASIIDCGVLSPLIVTKDTEDTSSFVILSGHRRKHILAKLAQEDPKFAIVPCIVRMFDTEAEKEQVLIESNARTRTLSDYEKMMQAVKLTEVYTELKKIKKTPGRVVDLVSKSLESSKSAIGRLQKVYNHLISEWIDAYRDELISTAQALKLADLSKDEQQDKYIEFIENGNKLNKAKTKMNPIVGMVKFTEVIDKLDGDELKDMISKAELYDEDVGKVVNSLRNLIDMLSKN